MMDFDRSRFKDEEEAIIFLKEHAPETIEIFLRIYHYSVPVYEEKGTGYLIKDITGDIKCMGITVEFEALRITPLDEAYALIT